MAKDTVDIDIKTSTTPKVETPPANPIKALLMSRKFLLGVVAVIQTIAAHYLDIPRDIWLAVDALIGIVIVSIAYEDGNK
jgi:hypothetical protein